MPGQTTFSTKFGFLIAKNHLDIELLLVFSDDSAYFLILRNVRQVTWQASQNQNSVHSKTSTRYLGEEDHYYCINLYLVNFEVDACEHPFLHHEVARPEDVQAPDVDAG